MNMLLLLGLALLFQFDICAETALRGDVPEEQMKHLSDNLNPLTVGNLGTTAGTNCPASENTGGETNIPTLCRQDAFEQICSGHTRPAPKDDETVAKIQLWKKRYDGLLAPCEEWAAKQAQNGAKKLNEINDFILKKIAETNFNLCLNNGTPEKTEKVKIKEVMNEIVDSYKAVLASSWDTAIASKATEIADMMRSCFENPMIDTNTLQNHMLDKASIANASVSRSTHNPRTLNGKGVRGLLKSCKLQITPGMWQRCLKRDPMCMSMLMHEAGHLVNSCVFAEHIYGGHQLRVPSPPPADPDVLKLSQGFAKSTNFCLQGLVTPKFAILNACPVPALPIKWKANNDKWRERCPQPDEHLPGHPSQWFESEADLWASSAMAFWLDSKYRKDVQSKRNYIQKSIEGFCQYQHDSKALYPARKLPQSGQCYEQAINPNLSQLPESWDDPHFGPKDRINNLWLRNDDLRGSLGCSQYPIKDNKNGLTCSPRGSQNIILK